jgi:hypothetical protein
MKPSKEAVEPYDPDRAVLRGFTEWATGKVHPDIPIVGMIPLELDP